MKSSKTEVLSFDIDEYNSRECQVHNHGFYLGEQYKQVEVDELQKRIDDALKNISFEQWSDEYGDFQTPTHNLIKILKGEETK